MVCDGTSDIVHITLAQIVHGLLTDEPLNRMHEAEAAVVTAQRRHDVREDTVLPLVLRRQYDVTNAAENAAAAEILQDCPEEEKELLGSLLLCGGGVTRKKLLKELQKEPKRAPKKGATLFYRAERALKTARDPEWRKKMKMSTVNKQLQRQWEAMGAPARAPFTAELKKLQEEYKQQRKRWLEEPRVPALRLCEGCHKSLREGHFPKTAIANGFFMGHLPVELQQATWLERQLCIPAHKVRVCTGVRRILVCPLSHSSTLRVSFCSTCTCVCSWVVVR
jgi:hypothetical protein